MTKSLSALFGAVLLTMSLGLTGCVSQHHADDLTSVNRTLKERIVELEGQIDELNQRIQLMQSSGSATGAEIAALTSERDALQAQVTKLLSENEQLKVENRRLMAAGNNIPVEVENALKRFAARYPNLVVYDQATGAVKFASDFTFGLGSAELSGEAANAIPKLAEVFNSPAASQYEVRVVGHTDTVRIANPATKAKHPTNWHLSVHRAIAVRDALAKAGVAELRTSVSGYGPYRPVAQNTRRGEKNNRRVEVYLVPMTPVNQDYLQPTGSGPAPASTGTTAPTTTDTEPEGPGALYK
jgi:chemotaxis protein MotB